MERLSKANCRQEKTGSCAGCPVYNLAYLPQREKAWNVVRDGSHDLDEYIERARELRIVISKKLCPEDKVMQTVQTSQGIWLP